MDDFIGLSDIPKFNYMWAFIGVLIFVGLIRIVIDCAQLQKHKNKDLDKAPELVRKHFVQADFKKT